jgi:hypothetical protein
VRQAWREGAAAGAARYQTLSLDPEDAAELAPDFVASAPGPYTALLGQHPNGGGANGSNGGR